jgi:SAM-dependent methyltransferase
MAHPVTTNFLESIRLAELRQIEEVLANTIPVGAKILEIGAGTGWQARQLSVRGYKVSAVDIPSSNHGNARIWPITDFDGRHLPFPDKSFDLVYSSNVLEHVEDIVMLNTEIVRVLGNEGRAIHFVPTSAWRAWSLMAFYPALLLDVLRRVRSKLEVSRVREVPSISPTEYAVASNQRPFFVKFVRRIVPHAHGAAGTCFSELLRFSKRSWDKFFLTSGWTIISYNRNWLFLTGDMILGSRLSTECRRRLSHTLGCTAHLYVLKRRTDQ